MDKFEVDDTSVFFKSLSCLFSSRENFDVTFIVGGRKVKAHRLILAFQSDFFNTLLFDNQFKEGELKEIPIEAPREAFELFLKYIYSAKLSLGPSEEMFDVYSELLDLSRRFGVQSLERAMIKYFLVNIKLSNVLRILNLSVLFEAKDLKEKCLQEMSKSGAEIFKHSQIADLPVASLMEILSSSHVTVTIWKFYALQRWSSCNSMVDRKALTDLVDVSKLSNAQILKTLAPSKLFEDSYLLKVLADRSFDKVEEVEGPVSCKVEVTVGRKFNQRGKKSIESSWWQGKEVVGLKLQSLAYSLSFHSRLRGFAKPALTAAGDEKSLVEVNVCLQTMAFGQCYVAVCSEEPFREIKIFNTSYISDLKIGLGKKVDASF